MTKKRAMVDVAPMHGAVWPTPHKYYRTVLGIDPGNNGGVAVFKWNQVRGFYVSEVFQLERGEDAIVEFFGHRADDGENADGQVIAFLEKVHGWGVGRSFNFGMYYGFVRGVVMASGIPIRDVQPTAWMKGMGVPPQKGEKAKHRQAIREIAGGVVQKPPGGLTKATNWSAAAVLIGQYGINLMEKES